MTNLMLIQMSGAPGSGKTTLAQAVAIKLHPPRPRSRFIPRAHLAERLQQGMTCSLTLLSAAVGFGNTTLLAQWLATSGISVGCAE